MKGIDDDMSEAKAIPAKELIRKLIDFPAQLPLIRPLGTFSPGEKGMLMHFRART
jgi:hypothetical protein